MTDDRSLERAARRWIEEGPSQAPDRPVDAALSRIQTTRQERDLRIPWRLQTMNPVVRLGGAALLVAIAIGIGALALRPASSVGPVTPTGTPSPAPSPAASPLSFAASLAAYKAARDAVCRRMTAASPIPEIPDWKADPAGAAEFLRQVIARGNEENAALAALSAPAAIEAEHLANVQTGRDTVAVLQHERQLLLDGKAADALAVDAATGPLSSTFEAFEQKYGLEPCA